MIPFRDLAQYEEGDWLFWRIGKFVNVYISEFEYEPTWVYTGEIKEADDSHNFFEQLKSDPKFTNDPEWLNRHDFMILKKQ
jgi:hypothetical protein